jgi:alkanesulfonate monooxygenase SsuD/methylene tetrahydromethanopterin reductase-like flavin-dependent oxidoreductase (luciferase family)
MIQEACVAIEELSEYERRLREAKYARRNKMRYIDRLLNELEMLNLAEQRDVPRPLAAAVGQLVMEGDMGLGHSGRPDSVVEAMDALYEIQDGLMDNPIGDDE